MMKIKISVIIQLYDNVHLKMMKMMKMNMIAPLIQIYNNITFQNDEM